MLIKLFSNSLYNVWYLICFILRFFPDQSIWLINGCFIWHDHIVLLSLVIYPYEQLDICDQHLLAAVGTISQKMYKAIKLGGPV